MIEAAAYWPPRDTAYFFRGDHYIRYKLSGGEKIEEIVPFSAKRWNLLPYDSCIDAVATVQPHEALYFFKEDTVVAYGFDDVAKHLQPVKVTDLFDLPVGWQGGFDTVMFWPPNGKMYFFKGDKYLRYNLDNAHAEEVALIAERWRGLTFNDIDASFVGSRGLAYFFKGGEYIRYIVSENDHAKEPARPIQNHWPGLLQAMKKLSPCSAVSIPPVEDPNDTTEQPTGSGSGGSSSVMEVGFNYPWAWHAMGEYFGAGKTPNASPKMDNWLTDLRINLRKLKTELNIKHVRIFLLCNAWNYGSVVAASAPPLHNAMRDKFTPPSSLHPKYLDHLTGILKAFQAEEMFVIPSLIHHSAFHPQSTRSGGGRADIVNDPAIRTIFFEQVIEPFLIASKPYKKNIYAWEVNNEPIYNTDREYESLETEALIAVEDIKQADMVDFIKKALDRIAHYGFQSTVGHRYYQDLAKFGHTGSKRQFHYYPKIVDRMVTTDPNPLPDFATTKAFIGEFSAMLGGGIGIQEGAWPELNGLDTTDVATAVFERLRLLNKKGYKLALLWPNILGPGYREDPVPTDTIKLSPEAMAGIQKYMASP